MVSMSYVAWMVEFMASSGISRAALLKGTGLESRDLSEPGGISDAQHICLLRNALQLSRDPALGLALGSDRPISTFDSLGFAMLCSETLREAIQMGCQYQKVPGRFSGRLVFLSLRTEGDEAVLEVKAAVAPDDLVLFAVEDMLGSILSVTRWVTGRPLPLREIRCGYPRPAHGESYRQYLPCPVGFDAPRTQVRFDAAFLDTRLPMASSNAARIYRAQCEKLINADGGGEDEWVRNIRTQMLLFSDRPISLEECAARLGVSPRTLRRRLKERGASYKGIVDDVRAELARSYLESSRLSVEAIAERLGFSDPTCFTRAFRRWTGMSPREFRKRESRAPWPSLFGQG
ncbi:MAG: AraC family transcriptional regulator [Armatimonadetes bacterium]|nr:AraC family transcriptional regulator [Armatimonadota bacterium]